MILPAPHLVVVSPKKRKEKKRNINNDLADLPSHDITPNITSTFCGKNGWHTKNGARLLAHKPVDN